MCKIRGNKPLLQEVKESPPLQCPPRPPLPHQDNTLHLTSLHPPRDQCQQTEEATGETESYKYIIVLNMI